FTIWEEKEAVFHERLQQLKNPEVFEVCGLRNVVLDIKECVTKRLQQLKNPEWYEACGLRYVVLDIKECVTKRLQQLKNPEVFEVCGLRNVVLDIKECVTKRLQQLKNPEWYEVCGLRNVVLDIKDNNCDVEKFSFELPYVKPNISLNSANSSVDDNASTTESLWSGDTTDSLNNPVFCNIMELLKLCHSFCSMSEFASGRQEEDYYIRGYTDRFNKLVKQLMQLLVSLRDRPCGMFLARLLMRLDYNRWLSGEAQLTQSVTNMLRY
ncbi:Gamma-tubulin complex component 4 (Gcp-4), partial [Operophtera brumata]